jgi:UDP-N-acetylmuramate--alanine ligase
MMNQQDRLDDFFEKLSADKAAGMSVYFLGIGGIGMSAIARYFNSRGVKVSGYDKTETDLTLQLKTEGIKIHFDDNIEQIDKQAVLVVYTPAIPKDHAEYNYLLENDYVILKRSEVLGRITSSSFNICVAGTHGKTTTSTMIAHILKHSGYGCNAFLGGISSNYETNFWSSEKNVCVAEADEYDRSFLRLNPDVAVITAMDPDHLDIYGDEKNFRKAFEEFTGKVKPSGLLFSKYGLDNSGFTASVQKTYSISDTQADCFAENIKMQNGSYCFDVKTENGMVNNIVLNMGGMHNVENAVVSVSVAKHLGLSDDKIRASVEAFKGVKRRFEYIIKKEAMVMIDDYAHHPQELTALLSSAKSLFPEKKCMVVFQPHLYTRTRDFAEGFAAALNIADEVYLLPIYPAREKPIEGVESEMIAVLMNSEKVVCCTKEELLIKMKFLKTNNNINMLITAGAGDIDTLVDPIKEILNN